MSPFGGGMEIRMKTFHECELKLKINDQKLKETIMNRMQSNGYIKGSQSTETDYILDTEKKDFDKQLFRIRKYSSEEVENLIFTIKIKGESKVFQDNMEYEICASECKKGDAENMKAIVKNLTGIVIPEKVFFEKNVLEVLNTLEKFGFRIKRIIQKRRDEYIGENAKIMFDIFPEPVGTYLEIEAGSEKILEEEVKRIGVENFAFEKRNYGQIIRETTNGKSRLLFD